MNQVLRLTVLAFASMPFHTEPARSSPTASLKRVADPRFAERIERFREDLETLRKERGIPGMSVAVVRDQEVIFAQGFGYSDLENNVPATERTPYNIASCTKPLAGVVLMKLVEEGKLDLDADMADVLKDKLFPIGYQGKEIRGHQAFCEGVLDIINGGSSPLAADVVSGFRKYCEPQRRPTVRQVFTHTAEGKPGSEYAYNGDVYSLLSLVAEEVSGKEFDKLLVETLVRPLEMTRTYPSFSQAIGDDVLASRSKYYEQRGAEGFTRTSVERPIKWPAVFERSGLLLAPSFLVNAGAGVVTTVLDLANFDMALDRNRIISGATKEMMFTPSRTNAGRRLPYGLGWFVHDWNGKRLIWHHGYHGSYSSLILKVTTDELTFILLANSAGASAGTKLGGGADPENVLKSPFAAAFLKRFVPQQVYPDKAWTRADKPEDLGWSSAKLAEAKSYSEEIGSAAVMIVDDGVVVESWGNPGRKYHCHSMRKSIMSALYGIYVGEGKIAIEKTLGELGVDDNTPLSATEKEATIADLLAARSGIYLPCVGESGPMKANRPSRGSHPPGTFWYYNNWDFNALGTIFDQETKETSIYQAFQRRIAEPLGMQDFALDKHHYAYEPYTRHPYYGFRMSTRDLARFGLVMLRDGRWRDQQIIPSEWVHDSTAGHSVIAPDSGYGYMWWTGIRGGLFPNVNVSGHSYYAAGASGHWIIVLPYRNLVIVHRVNTDDPGHEVYDFQMGTLLWLILDAAGDKDLGEAPRIGSAESERVTSEGIRQAVVGRHLCMTIGGKKIVMTHSENSGLTLSIGKLDIPAKWWLDGDMYCNDLPSGLGGCFQLVRNDDTLKLYDRKGYLFLRFHGARE